MISSFCIASTTPDAQICEVEGKKYYRLAPSKLFRSVILADLIIGIAILVIGQLSAQTSAYYLLTGLGAGYTLLLLSAIVTGFKCAYFRNKCILYNGTNFKECDAYFSKRAKKINDMFAKAQEAAVKENDKSA